MLHLFAMLTRLPLGLFFQGAEPLEGLLFYVTSQREHIIYMDWI